MTLFCRIETNKLFNNIRLHLQPIEHPQVPQTKWWLKSIFYDSTGIQILHNIVGVYGKIKYLN